MFRHIAAVGFAALTFPAFAAVEINQATQAQLESVKGIGPALSAKILEARKAGNFKSWSDLQDRVSGVGPGSAAKLSQAGLTVGGSAYADAPKPAGKSGDGSGAKLAPRADGSAAGTKTAAK